MNIRKSIQNDVLEIMNIIEDAKISLLQNNISQWSSNYPNEHIILDDIKKGGSFVLEDNKKIIATFFLSFEKDNIYESSNINWINNSKYATIHRVAIKNEHKQRGIASTILKYCVDFSKLHNMNSIRIDTHISNFPMINFIKKHNFIYCGKVCVFSDIYTEAFEKNI